MVEQGEGEILVIEPTATERTLKIPINVTNQRKQSSKSNTIINQAMVEPGEEKILVIELTATVPNLKNPFRTHSHGTEPKKSLSNPRPRTEPTGLHIRTDPEGKNGDRTYS